MQLYSQNSLSQRARTSNLSSDMNPAWSNLGLGEFLGSSFWQTPIFSDPPYHQWSRACPPNPNLSKGAWTARFDVTCTRPRAQRSERVFEGLVELRLEH